MTPKQPLSTRLGIVVLAVLLAFPALIVSAADPTLEERDFSASVSDALVSLAKKLPTVWRIKREAKKLARTLPDYAGEVPVPDSGLIYSWIEALCSTPHRRPGTAEDRRAEEWIATKLREFGLQNVTLDPVPLTVWTADQWSLAVEGEEVPGFFVVNAGFTPPQGVTAPLVYVGEGKAKDFAQVDVAGKIVVGDVPFPYLPSGFLLKAFGGAYLVSDPDKSFSLSSGQYLNFVRLNFKGQSDEQTASPDDVYWNAVKGGAKGVLLILRDQPSRYNTHYGPYDGIMKPLPGLWIGKYDGEGLRRAARAGSEATLTLTGSMAPGTMRNVWGTLPGVSDEVILVTSHHDSPFQGASEDGAGTAQVLAQAWAWAQVPAAQRPKTLVFVLDAGHFYGSKGGRAFARQHPEIMDRARLLLTLEHLGAKEVVEKDGEYETTGQLALTVMFTSSDPKVVAGLMKAVKKQPPRRMAAIPADFFGGAPTSDAAGYVVESQVPVISWIGCPYYLLDSGDTLDKIDRDELAPIAKTATEIVKTFMAMD